MHPRSIRELCCDWKLPVVFFRPFYDEVNWQPKKTSAYHVDYYGRIELRSAVYWHGAVPGAVEYGLVAQRNVIRLEKSLIRIAVCIPQNDNWQYYWRKNDIHQVWQAGRALRDPQSPLNLMSASYAHAIHAMIWEAGVLEPLGGGFIAFCIPEHAIKNTSGNVWAIVLANPGRPW